MRLMVGMGLFLGACGGTPQTPRVVDGGELPCRGDGAFVAAADERGLWTTCRDAATSLPAGADGAGAMARLEPPRATRFPFPADAPLGQLVALARDGEDLGIVWSVRDSADLAAARLVKGKFVDVVRHPGLSPTRIVGVWIAVGALHVATAEGARVSVATTAAPVGCADGFDGSIVAAWLDGVEPRLLGVAGERAFTCRPDQPSTPVPGFLGLAQLDRSVAGLVGLFDAGIATSRLEVNGTITALSVPAAALALPAIHGWRDHRLVRYPRWNEAGITRTDLGDRSVRVGLDAELRLQLDGEVVASAARAPVDLAAAVPILAGSEARPWLLTTTGLYVDPADGSSTSTAGR